ncbi:MAG TPA: hypothetical protein ENF64_03350 [Hadesarchaea archaeon]|nr:hypothetical protein [Hadesarchaea archaeon]
MREDRRFPPVFEKWRGVRVDERGTSSRCPWCGSEALVKRGRLLKCKSCGVEAHRDVAGALNIGAVRNGGHVSWAVAHPSEVRA